VLPHEPKLSSSINTFPSPAWRQCIPLGNPGTSEDNTVEPPPSTKFLKKEGGYLEEKFFIRDFLYKTFSENLIRKKEGGIYSVIL